MNTGRCHRDIDTENKDVRVNADGFNNDKMASMGDAGLELVTSCV